MMTGAAVAKPEAHPDSSTTRSSGDRVPVDKARPLSARAGVERGSLLLEVDDLSIEFDTDAGIVHAVNGVSYSISAGETLALVGESGSGKTATAQALLDLIPTPPGRISSGSLRLNGVDLLSLKRTERRRIAGARISMVFQDPLAALNPVFTVGAQVAEAFAVHGRSSRSERRELVTDLLAKVGIPSPRSRLGDYPHQFSGGMRQRILIAMAIALRPALLVADEPTSALDVTVQAQILDLLAEIQDESTMALLLITHDLGIVGTIADRVAVMYAGRIVEIGPAREVLATPAHPYTRALAASQPRRAQRGRPLHVIRGAPPDPTAPAPGCPFAPRCEFAQDRCSSERPLLGHFRDTRLAACHFASEVARHG